MRIMNITFEGEPPYELPLAQSAIARAAGEIVEILLIVPASEPASELPLIRARMTHSAAKQLASQLIQDAAQAEYTARQQS